DPGHRAVEHGLLDERRRLALQRLAVFLHLLQRKIFEAGADVRGIVHLLLLVPIAEQQRAERLARTLAAGVTADDEVRTLHRLDLQPRPRGLGPLLTGGRARVDS